MTIYFSGNEAHTCDKQSLKISKRFDYTYRRYCVLNLCFITNKLFSSIIQSKRITDTIMLVYFMIYE